MTDTVETKYGIDLDEFVADYIAAMLFSTSDLDDESGDDTLEKNYSNDDIAPEAMEKIRADCLEFLNSGDGGGMIALVDRLEAEGRYGHTPGSPDDTPTAHAGRDFWYTRVGHGVGFWDGDWKAGIGRRMDKLAKRFGEVWPYVGDDGKIYV
jgi:Ca2+-binding RTX toxin-like protein